MIKFNQVNFSLIITIALHLFLASWPIYEFTVLTSLEPYVKKFTLLSVKAHYGHVLTETQLAFIWSAINTVLPLGCLVGSAFLRPVTDNFGRRNSVMLFRNVIYMIAVTMEFASRPLNMVELLIIGRFFGGFCVPFSSFVPTFLGECAPTDKRGVASTIMGVSSNIAILSGTVIALPQLFGSENLWHYALILPIIPSFLHLLATPLVPKSPKYLFIVEKREEESRKAIRFYHGKRVNSEKVLAEYRKEALLTTQNKRISLKEILSTRHLKWPFFLCILTALVRPVSGIFVIQQYATGAMEQLGIPQGKAALFNVLALQIPGFFSSLLATTMIERFGRRLVLLLGQFLMILGLCLLSVAGYLYEVSPDLAAVLSIGGMCLSINGHAIGPLTLYMILPSEICPQAIRSQTASWAMVIMWVFALVTVFAYPPLNVAIGSAAVLPMIITSSGVWLFLWKFLPETKGKTVEETVKKWIS